MGKYKSIIVILALHFMLVTPAMWIALTKSVDFELHYRGAIELPGPTTALPFQLSHVLFHAVIKIFQQLSPAFSRDAVLFLSILTFMQLLPVIIFLLLKRSARTRLPEVALIALTLGLIIAAPVTFWYDNKHMIGYINSMVYHNPTFLALRLFVIPLSLLSLWVVNSRNYPDLNNRLFYVLLAAVIMMLATLSKPSYTIVMLPGLILFALWQRLKMRAVDWKYFIWGLCIPGAFIVAIEYIVTFASGQEHGGTISFGFLTWLTHYVPAWRIPFQTALSLVFPIGVYLLYFAEARKSLYLNFSWTVFGIALLLVYCLYQDGIGFKAGDFVWSSYSAIFVLMFASLKFLIEQYAGEKDASFRESRAGLRSKTRTRIALFLFSMHVLFGLVYYLRFMEAWIAL